MHIPISDKARTLALRPGEFQLFCLSCDYRAEKNCAMKPICPECGAQMHIAEAFPAVKTLADLHALIPWEAIITPDFEHAGRVHDWRNHVDPEVKEQWDQLSLEARQVAYLSAYNEAEREEWD